MAIYDLEDVKKDENDFKSEYENSWWLDYYPMELMSPAKGMLKVGNVLVIPSYTYTEIFKQGVADIINGVMDEGLYASSLVCIIGMYAEDDGYDDFVQFLEVYEVWKQNRVYNSALEKVYIVKMRLFKSNYKNNEHEFDLFEMMQTNIDTSDDDFTVFEITGDCITYGEGDCTFCANASVHTIIQNAYVRKGIPLIAVTTEGIKTTYANEFMRIIDFHNLLKVFEETTKRFL